MTYNDGPAESWLLVPPGEADATDGRMDATAPYGRALYGRSRPGAAVKAWRSSAAG
jgi:transcription elongation GreA/GreB family factor